MSSAPRRPPLAADDDRRAALPDRDLLVRQVRRHNVHVAGLDAEGAVLDDLVAVAVEAVDILGPLHQPVHRPDLAVVVDGRVVSGFLGHRGDEEPVVRVLVEEQVAGPVAPRARPVGRGPALRVLLHLRVGGEVAQELSRLRPALLVAHLLCAERAHLAHEPLRCFQHRSPPSGYNPYSARGLSYRIFAFASSLTSSISWNTRIASIALDTSVWP